MSAPATWFPLLSALLVVLIAASALERPIKQIFRSRWPAFDYDGPAMLCWGVATLGALTMLIVLALALVKP